MIGVLVFVGVICIVLILHFVHARSSEALQPIPSLRLESAAKDSTDRPFEDQDPDPSAVGQLDRSGEDAPVTDSIGVQ